MGALDELVEVETTTPLKSNDRVTLNLGRNFSKVLIVKINADFDIAARLVDRKALPRVKGTKPVSTGTTSARRSDRDQFGRHSRTRSAGKATGREALAGDQVGSAAWGECPVIALTATT